MKEQIKELSEQADLYARSDNSSMIFENFQKRYTEKLVELIVTKCAVIATRCESNGNKNIGAEILEYFGVER